MKHNKYSEVGKDDKEIRKVTITDEQAKRFNKRSKDTGLTYKPVKEQDNSPKIVKFNDQDVELSKAIEGYNSIEGIKKLNKKTGIKKVQEAIDSLTEEQKPFFDVNVNLKE